MNRCILGDCRDVMRQLIADGVKVQTIVTSPPYYGLRNYGVDGQLGLEETPQQFIANMVEVFSVAWDLLADDGTLWLNIGDSYNGNGKGAMADGSVVAGGKQATNKGTTTGIFVKSNVDMCKRKELMMIPARLAIALSDAGWYLRQDIIWAKPNPMPESVKDRCTKSHEYIFLLTKQPGYYCDMESIKELSVDPIGTSKRYEKPFFNGVKNISGGYSVNGAKHTSGMKNLQYKGQSNHSMHEKILHGGDEKIPIRNKRSVWTINTKPCTEAHFAVMPEELIENCILAGSKVGDIVFDPFMGSGTVGRVAQKLGRKWLGAELNPEYIKIQHKRTAQQALELA